MTRIRQVFQWQVWRALSAALLLALLLPSLAQAHNGEHHAAPPAPAEALAEALPGGNSPAAQVQRIRAPELTPSSCPGGGAFCCCRSVSHAGMQPSGALPAPVATGLARFALTGSGAFGDASLRVSAVLEAGSPPRGPPPSPLAV